MATTVGGSQCNYCGQHRGQVHDPACPEVIGTETAKLAWEYGYREGVRETFFPEHKFKTMHPSRVLGYRMGDRWMDEYYFHLAQDDDY